MARGTDPHAELRGTTLQPGAMFGPYRVEREVGRGGMGVVYEAMQLSLNRRVALKVLPFQRLGSGRRSFSGSCREAQAAAGLHHTNIVPVFDVGAEDGTPYYAMQFIEGNSLDRLQAADRPRCRRPIPTAPWTASAGRPRCRPGPAVRDRGPPAFSLRRQRRRAGGRGAWPTPTGAASSTATSSRRTCCSTPRAASGSPTSAWPSRRTTRPDAHRRHRWARSRYMAPEQAAAASVRSTTAPTSTAWALTLYELLTLRPAFDGGRPARADRADHHEEPVPPAAARPARSRATWRRSSSRRWPRTRRALRHGRGAGRRPAAVPRRRADPGPAHRLGGPADPLVAAKPGRRIVTRRLCALGAGDAGIGRRPVAQRRAPARAVQDLAAAHARLEEIRDDAAQVRAKAEVGRKELALLGPRRVDCGPRPDRRLGRSAPSRKR